MLTKGKKILLLTASFLVYIEESIFTSETKRKTLNKIKRLRDKRKTFVVFTCIYGRATSELNVLKTCASSARLNLMNYAFHRHQQRN